MLKFIVVLATLSLILAYTSAQQTAKSYNFARARKGAKTMTWSAPGLAFEGCGFQMMYRDPDDSPFGICVHDRQPDSYHYNKVFSDSRQSVCVPVLNDFRQTIRIESAVIKRIYMYLTNGPCNVRILASPNDDTKVSIENEILNEANVPDGPNTFPVNSQNGQYSNYALYATTVAGQACNICAIEMFTG